MSTDVFFIFKLNKEETFSNIQRKIEKGKVLSFIEIKKEDDKFLKISGYLKNKNGWGAFFNFIECKNNNYLEIQLFTDSEPAVIECIKLVKEIYLILKKPVIAFDESSYGWDPVDFCIWGNLADDSQEYNYDLIVFDTIFDFNIFTPEKVKKIGKKKLLSLPKEICENIEELSDGAISILPGNTLNINDSQGSRRNAIRKHLGMKTYGKK